MQAHEHATKSTSITGRLIRYGSTQAMLDEVWADAGSRYTSSAARPRAGERFRWRLRWLLGAGVRRSGHGEVRADVREEANPYVGDIAPIRRYLVRSGDVWCTTSSSLTFQGYCKYADTRPSPRRSLGG